MVSEIEYRKILEIAHSLRNPIDTSLFPHAYRKRYSYRIEDPQTAMFAVQVLKEAALESESAQELLALLSSPPTPLGTLGRVGKIFEGVVAIIAFILWLALVLFLMDFSLFFGFLDWL